MAYKTKPEHFAAMIRHHETAAKFLASVGRHKAAADALALAAKARADLFAATTTPDMHLTALVG